MHVHSVSTQILVQETVNQQEVVRYKLHVDLQGMIIFVHTSCVDTSHAGILADYYSTWGKNLLHL